MERCTFTVLPNLVEKSYILRIAAVCRNYFQKELSRTTNIIKNMYLSFPSVVIQSIII
jgi:hypothetical protein